MSKRTIKQDLEQLMKNPDAAPIETKHFIANVNRFADQRKMSGEKAKVDLLLLVAGALRWEEEEFFGVIQRLSRVAISQSMGIPMKELEEMMQAAVMDSTGSSKKTH